MWIVAAIFSAVFAGLTAVLSKCGVKNANSDVATAIRTSIVLVFAWGIVFLTGEYSSIPNISFKSWMFLILSGLATGASWLCYFKALSLGEASRVAAVDKSSVVLSILFAVIVFPEERTNLVVKSVCLAGIAVGTYLMTDIKKSDGEQGKAWFLFAGLSAVFAAATSCLAKIGIENVNSDVATAVRTCVVFAAAWLVVIGKGESKLVKEVDGKELAFIGLSGVATGVSWLCYYYAISKGLLSVVVPIDKTSVLITVALSVAVFKEKLSFKFVAGLILLVAGTVFIAVFA